MRAAVLLLCVAACTDGASAELGLGNQLLVDGAQYRPGAFPEATGGPAALALETTHATVVIGEHRERLRGILEPAARAAIIGVPGDRGTWIVPAGPPDLDAPGDAAVHAVFGIGDPLAAGPFTLQLAAVDEAGRIGAPATVDLVAAPAAPPEGTLVIGLSWHGNADLDLHVVDPLGNEAYQGNPNTTPPAVPGEPRDPNAWLTGGILDHDANAQCTIEGAPAEYVIWKPRTGSNGPVEPVIPPGTYTVRVEARSMCGDPAAVWTVSAYRDGVLLGAARGTSTPEDALYGTHGAGGGTTALTFVQ